MKQTISKITSKTLTKLTLTASLLTSALLPSGLIYAEENKEEQTSDQAVLTDFENTVTSVVEKTKEAVVSVCNYQQQLTNPSESIYGFYQGIDLREFDSTPQLAGTGSGVIYKIEGDLAYIVTNHHVIDGADSLEVIMGNGDSVEAQLVGGDSVTDLAVMTIPAEHASKSIEFANSDQISVGSIAIAIGSPLGIEYATSVTQGIVSGVNRPVVVDGYETQLIQTDAAINPGNSGGALVNSQGQLIGINQIKYAQEEVEGMGFAIPSNDVANIIKQLEAHGKVIRPALGITTMPVTRFNMESRTEILKLDPSMTDGAVIWEIQSGSPSDKAGLEELDVIIKLGEEEVTSPADIKSILYSYNIGDTLPVTVLRGGKEVSVDITLDMSSEELQSSEASQNR